MCLTWLWLSLQPDLQGLPPDIDVTSVAEQLCGEWENDGGCVGEWEW
jgi:hypothetical protein